MVKELVLKDGTIVFVSDEDFDEVSKHTWYKNQQGYIEGTVDGKTIRLHRLIMDPQEDMVIDHINRNRVDNRRENLRIVTRLENGQNKTISPNKYRGVYYDLASNKYRVKFIYKKEHIGLGGFDDEIIAAEKFDIFIVHNKLENIELNFPDKREEYLAMTYTPYVKEKVKTTKYNGVSVRGGSTNFVASIQINKKGHLILVSDSEIKCAEAFDKYVVENKILNKPLNFPDKYPDYVETSMIKTKCEPVDGNTVKLLIKNDDNISVIVDENNYDKVKNYRWYRDTTYIYGYVNGEKVSLHRFIMGSTNSAEYIDHIDSNPYNNTKINLRKTDAKGNSQNKNKKKNASSKHIGVYWCKKAKKWNTRVEKQHLGRYDNEDSAGRRRDLHIMINMPESNFKLNFTWELEDIEKWKQILNIV